MRAALFAAAALLAPAAAQSDSSPYVVEHFPTPDGARLEIAGIDFLPDGRLVASTRRGQVWILENPEAPDVAEARWSLFAEGLQEGLGLKVLDREVYVLQRGELSRLRDRNQDGRADHVDTIAADWGLSGNYHEFAYGLPVDRLGRFVVTLNVAFVDPKWWHGQALVPYRGWALMVDKDGAVKPWAYGFRSPCGVGTNALGDVFVTDNQGDWCPSSPIYHLVEGGFYGHPASLNWTEEYRSSGTKASDEVPPPAASERRPAAIWIPYKWSRSTGNMVADVTGGEFGPFHEQLFVAELTNGMVLRADMEKVNGEYQGWIVPFQRDVGSVCRVAFGPEGSLFCGLTNRGWGGKPPADGLARIRWSGRTPMQIERVHLVGDGFDVRLSQPIAADVEVDAAQITVQQYDYNYWWEYGSPETNRRDVELASVELSADRRTLSLRANGLVPAMVARVRLPRLRAEGGDELEEPEFAYTINQLPGAPPTTEHVAKVVPPPPSKESGQEGWLMLSWIDPLDRFESEGWVVRDVEIDPADAKRFDTTEGDGALVNAGEAPSHYVSKDVFGDQELHLDFMLPQGGNSGVYLMGRYEVQLLDSSGVEEPGFGDCGGIYRGASWEGSPPSANAFRGPGEWHELDVTFRAPRFDGDGKKVRDARFVSVAVDGVVVQEDVSVPEPTISAMFADEAASGPLMLQGDHGPVAFRDIRVKPLGLPDRGDGWAPVFPEDLFDDWITTEDAEWELDGDTITGSGTRGHLFSPRGDYVNFDLRARVKVVDGGNSGLYFRVTPTNGWPTGYEAQVNSTHPDPQKSGGLYGLAPVKAGLVPADTWFDYFVSCRDTDAGTHVRIEVNGVTVTDHVDAERRYASGHIALQQHHEGSLVQFQNVEIREVE